MEEKAIDIRDPKVWSALTVKARTSTITELQSILLIASMQHSGFGALLVKRRAEGRDLSKEMLLVERKDEKSVDARTRRKMSDQQEWRLRLWPVKGKAPPGTGKPFAAQFKIVKTSPLPDGSDLYCLICSAGNVYRTTISLDSYLEAIAPPAPAPIDVPAPVEPEPAGGDTFESIVALITGISPGFDWTDWLTKRVADGATTLLGGIFAEIQPRVAAFIEKAHVKHLETRRDELTDRLKQLRELSAPAEIIQANEKMLAETNAALVLRRPYTPPAVPPKTE